MSACGWFGFIFLMQIGMNALVAKPQEQPKVDTPAALNHRWLGNHAIYF